MKEEQIKKPIHKIGNIVVSSDGIMFIITEAQYSFDGRSLIDKTWVYGNAKVSIYKKENDIVYNLSWKEND